jgi:hypothetical protein
MGATTHSIEVNAPLRAVYNQWTQFEEFPRFMEGVDEVRQEGPKSLFWKTKMGGKDKQWETEITEQVPDKRIAWESVDGTPNRGEVTFESLDFERTRVTLTMEYEPEGFFAKAGDALGIPSGRVEGDLKRFRDFIEERGMETGGWRGQIEEGESGIGTDTIEAEGGESFQAAEHPSELAEEPSGLATELLGAQGKPQFDRAKAGVAAPTQEEIARRAYELYIERGQAPGNEREDWLEAEKELSERYGNNSPRTSA